MMDQQSSEENKKSTSSFFKRTLKILVWIFSILILLMLSAILISWIYQDEVKKYFTGILNQHLNTQVIISPEDIDFSVIEDFPLASLEFNNVIALDAIKAAKKDTLFKAE